jgi:hypothetical protein
VGHAARHADLGPDGPAIVRRGAVTLCAAAACLAAASPLPAQTWRTLTSARQRHGETSLTVDVSYAAGEFRLRSAPPGTLYQMDLRYDEERFTPVREYDADAARLSVGVRGAHDDNISLERKRTGPVPSLDLELSPDIPLTLNLDLGAVRAQVDFGGLALRSVRYRTGASESTLRFSRANPEPCSTLAMEAGAAAIHAWSLGNANCRSIRFDGGIGDVTLDFSGTWRGSMQAELRVALGSLTLMLPRDAGVAVRVSRFLASFERSGFEKRGDTYYTPGYDTAARRLTLDVTAAFGGVNVVWSGAPR